MNIEQDIAKSILAGKRWTIEELEVAAEVEPYDARVLITEWLQSGAIQQIDPQHFSFTDTLPPEGTDAAASPQPRRWRNQDTAMVALAIVALLIVGLSGTLLWHQSQPAASASLPDPVFSSPVPTSPPTTLPTATPTPDDWKRLAGSVVAYYAPDGDVAGALDPGTRYQPLARANGTTWVQVRTDGGDFWLQASEVRGLELYEAEALADLTPPTPVLPTPTERVVIVERVIEQPVYQQPQVQVPPVPAAPTAVPTAVPAPEPEPTLDEYCPPPEVVEDSADRGPAFVTSPDDIQWDLPNETVSGDGMNYSPRGLQQEPLQKPDGGDWTTDDVLSGQWNVWAWVQVGDRIVPVGITPADEMPTP